MPEEKEIIRIASLQEIINQPPIWVKEKKGKIYFWVPALNRYATANQLLNLSRHLGSKRLCQKKKK